MRLAIGWGCRIRIIFMKATRPDGPRLCRARFPKKSRCKGGRFRSASFAQIRFSTARWCNGSTTDSDSVCRGSNPCRAANFFKGQLESEKFQLRWPGAAKGLGIEDKRLRIQTRAAVSKAVERFQVFLPMAFSAHAFPEATGVQMAIAQAAQAFQHTLLFSRIMPTQPVDENPLDRSG